MLYSYNPHHVAGRDGINVAFVREFNKTAKDEDTEELIEKLSLIDTASSSKPWEDVAEEEGIHIFAFICPLSRYTEERKQFLENIVSRFGYDFFFRCILIFTQLYDNQTIAYKGDISSLLTIDDNLKKLSNTHKYILCPDVGKSPDCNEYKRFRSEFASSLLGIVFKCFKGTHLKRATLCTIL